MHILICYQQDIQEACAGTRRRLW